MSSPRFCLVVPLVVLQFSSLSIFPADVDQSSSAFSSCCFDCPGRILRVSHRSPGKIESTFWNFHLEGLSASNLNPFLPFLRADIDKALAHPDRFLLFCGGDLNASPGGFSRHYVKQPSLHEPVAPPTVVYRPVLQQLDRLAEILPDAPSHFDAKSESLTLKDRLFTGTPAWKLALAKSSVAVLEHPDSLFRRGISDHAPFSGQLRIGRRLLS